jgi:membrane protease YdiL (CAAX protease family)
MNINRKKIGWFIGLTFGFNWLLAFLFFGLVGNQNPTATLVMAIAYMFVPMVMAIVVQKFIYKEAVKGPLGISFRINRWFLVAWLLPPLLALATFGVSLLLPGVAYSPDMAGMVERFQGTLTPEQMAQLQAQTAALPIHPLWLGLLQGLIAGITVNAVAAFGEELGWRGFLQRELAGLGFWKSAGLIGLIWGVWHAPLILQGHNYPEHPVAGVAMMTLWCILLSPVMSYIRLRAKSVLAAAIFHGTLNGTVGLAILLVQGGNDLTVGLTGLAGFVVLALVNLGLLIYQPGHRLSVEPSAVI